MSLSLFILAYFVGLFDLNTSQKFDGKLRRRIALSEELIEHPVSSNRTDKKYNLTPESIFIKLDAATNLL